MITQTATVERNHNPVSHPPHYTAGKFECIDVILDWRLGFLLGNVLKYICRADKKGSELEDLQKARWYLEKRIEQIEKI